MVGALRNLRCHRRISQRLARPRSRAWARRNCGSRFRSEECCGEVRTAGEFNNRGVGTADAVWPVADGDVLVVDGQSENCFGLSNVHHDALPDLSDPHGGGEEGHAGRRNRAQRS
jgi:hypothetical protein